MKPSFNPLDHPICFTRPLWLYHLPGWVEHVPFGMLMIDLARPKILVELGTHVRRLEPAGNRRVNAVP